MTAEKNLNSFELSKIAHAGRVLLNNPTECWRNKTGHRLTKEAEELQQYDDKHGQYTATTNDKQ
jgi:hypothetical protein